MVCQWIFMTAPKWAHKTVQATGIKDNHRFYIYGIFQEEFNIIGLKSFLLLIKSLLLLIEILGTSSSGN